MIAQSIQDDQVKIIKEYSPSVITSLYPDLKNAARDNKNFLKKNKDSLRYKSKLIPNLIKPKKPETVVTASTSSAAKLDEARASQSSSFASKSQNPADGGSAFGKKELNAVETQKLVDSMMGFKHTSVHRPITQAIIETEAVEKAKDARKTGGVSLNSATGDTSEPFVRIG